MSIGCVELNAITSILFRDIWRRELSTLRTMGKHPNIISFFGFVSVGDCTAVVLEYCGYGNLWDFVHELPTNGIALSSQEFLRLAIQICDGMVILLQWRALMTNI